MQTDNIRIASDGSGREQALLEAEKYAQYVGLDRKKSLQLRLLTEEMLGMVTAITEDFDADFWIENTETGVCQLHLYAETEMNYTKKKELLSVSTSGKNEASKGFMGQIREMIENFLFAGEEEMDRMAINGDPFLFASMGMYGPDELLSSPMLYQWSLEQYRASISEKQAEAPEVKEAWDELEKSIVASIADDVRVSVSGSTVELVIEKNSF